MRILFAEYPGNTWNIGGKERRTRDMANALSSLGADVQYLNPWAPAETEFDVLQLFGSEFYQHEIVQRTKALGKPISLFSILVFDSERQRQLGRLWRYIDPVVPVATTFRLRQNILRAADLVMFSGEAEAESARDVYGVVPRKSAVVPSTVSDQFASATPDHFVSATGLKDFALSAGRIEPRKNTLRIIDATRQAQVPLVLIGHFDEAHPQFCRDVRAAIERDPHVHYFKPVPPSDPWLASAYAAAKLHVLASFHETCGMVNLEATMAGANVVSSPLPSVREYMADYAYYADPVDVDALSAAITKAYRAPFQPAAKEHVANNFTVEASARKMFKAYSELLGLT